MALNRTIMENILIRFSEKNKIDICILRDQIKDYYNVPTPWASEAAEKKAVDNELSSDDIDPTGKNGKITLDDVQNKLGIEKPKDLGQFVSKLAMNLAMEKNLIEDDFSKNERTGLNRKTKNKSKITLEDVRKKSGVSENNLNIFASKEAAKLAADNYLTKNDIAVRTGKDGKIKKLDVQNIIDNKGKDSDNEEEGYNSDKELKEVTSEEHEDEDEDEEEQEPEEIQSSDEE